MNLEILTKTRDWLLDGAPGYNFDMREQLMFSPECGTTCCIAGFIALNFAPDAARYNPSGSMGIAEKLLDLPRGVADDLFLPVPRPRWGDITPTEAAQAVQNIIDGKEPWE